SIHQRALNIEGSANTIFGGAQRKIDDPHSRSNGSQTLVARQSSRTLETKRVSAIGIAAVDAVLYSFQYWKETGERTDCSGFAGTAMPHDDDAADVWIDRAQQQRQLHLVLADDC